LLIISFFFLLALSGSAAEAMEDYERAIAAYESALRHNPYSVPAMNAIAGVHRTMDRFEKVRNLETLMLCAYTN
jgi:tetratricopeptide (TPR) repeat protein